jgi:ABC-type sugar transport system ATPase subunit
VIRLVDVVQHDGVRRVLKRINLEIRSRELMVILGPKGMGRTTLLAAIETLIHSQTLANIERFVGEDPP